MNPYVLAALCRDRQRELRSEATTSAWLWRVRRRQLARTLCRLGKELSKLGSAIGGAGSARDRSPVTPR